MARRWLKVVVLLYDRERLPGNWGQAFRYAVQPTLRSGCRVRRRAPGFWTVKDDTGGCTFPPGDRCQRARTSHMGSTNCWKTVIKEFYS